MRLLYVVQRYGDDIVGGAEAACRLFAEQLTRRGHAVEVLTSCVRDASTMEDSYQAGVTVVDDVVVHRLPVVHPRRPDVFGPLDRWVTDVSRPMPFDAQARWTEELGPLLRGQHQWLTANAPRFDAVIFMTFQYPTTAMGLASLDGVVPTVLQPAAHDEPALWLSQQDAVLRRPDSFCFFSPEEKELVERRVGRDDLGPVSGIGIEIPAATDPDRFRRRLGIGTRPYILYLGRFDELKGGPGLVRDFLEMKRHRRNALVLVCAGNAPRSLSERGDVISVGFLGAHEKAEALAGALALCQPSRMESFSIVLCEAWAHGRPAIVERDCPVLRGQAARSGGALVYHGPHELAEALETLLADPARAAALGAAGRAYVTSAFAWDRVTQTLESALDRAIAAFAQRDDRSNGAEGSQSEGAH